MNSTLMPPSGRPTGAWAPMPATSTSSRSGPNMTRWGLPMSTVRTRRSGNCCGWSSPEHGRPHARPSPRRRGRARPRGTSTVLTPAAGGDGEGRRERPAALSTAAWARQRIPLPLISASPPSAFCRTMVRSATSPPDCTRMTPSAPTPNRRSHRARTRSRAADRVPSGSTWTRKSLPAPWCLVKRRSGAAVVGGHGAPPSLSPSAPPADRGSAGGRGSTAPAVPPEPAADDLGHRVVAGAIHPIRGSRRNHDRWRRANVRVRRTASSTASVERHAVLHVGQQLPVAQGLAGRPRQPGRAGGQRPHLLEQPVVHQAGEPVADARGRRLGRRVDAHQATAAGG